MYLSAAGHGLLHSHGHPPFLYKRLLLCQEKAGCTCFRPAFGAMCQGRCLLRHVSDPDRARTSSDSNGGRGWALRRRTGFHALFSARDPLGLSETRISAEKTYLSRKSHARDHHPFLSAYLQQASGKYSSQY